MKAIRTIAALTLLVTVSAAAFAQVDLKSLDDAQLHSLQQQIQQELDLREAQKQAAQLESPEMQKFKAYEAAVAAVESAVQKKDRAAFDTAYKTAVEIEKYDIPEAKQAEFDALTARFNATLPNAPANSENDFDVVLTDDENAVIVKGISYRVLEAGKAVVVVPAQIQGMPVQTVCITNRSGYFRSTTLVLSKGIDRLIIYNEGGISRLVLPEGLEYLHIQTDSYPGVDSPTGLSVGDINFPSTLKGVSGCFDYEKEEIEIPNTIAYWSCKLYGEEVKKLVLPKSIYFEGKYLRFNFPKLEDVVIPENYNYGGEQENFENILGKYASIQMQKKLRNCKISNRAMTAEESAIQRALNAMFNMMANFR